MSAVRSAGPWRPSFQRSALLVLAAVAAVGLTHLIDFGVYHLRYTSLNANSSESWSHRVVAGALGAGALACALGAWRARSGRAAWIASAIVLALLGLVNAISGVHAEIDALNHGRLLYAPLLAVMVCCVWWLTWRGPYFGALRAGAALLLSSYVIHVLEPHAIAETLGWPVGGWGFQVVVVIKEGTELAGVLLALLGLFGAAVAAGGSEPRPAGVGGGPQVRVREGR